MIPEPQQPFPDWEIADVLRALDTSVLSMRVAREMLRAWLVERRELAAARGVCQRVEEWLSDGLDGTEMGASVRQALAEYRAVRAASGVPETDGQPLPDDLRAGIIRGLLRSEVERMAQG